VRDPGNNQLKAWSRDYNEPSFFFGQNFTKGSRLIAWTEEPEMMKAAFYKIVESMTSNISITVKICSERDETGKTKWAAYHGNPQKNHALDVFRQNESYVFSDGMHQLWIKDGETGRYLVFEDHGVFNLYFPKVDDEELFRSIGYHKKFADPIFSMPHFHRTEENSKQMEVKFISELGLQPENTGPN
jgi:hypothetical protein